MTFVDKDEAKAVRLTQSLHKAFDKICEDAKVYQGIGPAMAYFETPQTADGNVKRFVYITYGMAGERPADTPIATSDVPDEVLRASVEVFRQYLKPNRTLVWRERPSIESSGVRWASYWRCVQLDDDARRMTVDWHF